MKLKYRKDPYCGADAAFTLIELLTVIAIIGILAAIIIPTVGAVKTSANKAKTKVQFSQWSSSFALFRQEYGYYPSIGTSNKIDSEKFSGALTGRNLAGTKYTTTTDANLCGNKRVLAFYSIADSELNDDKTKIVDAFGNIDIAYAVDADGNGVVSGTNPENLVAVAPIDETVTATPDIPSGGIRAGVIFYSAGKGGATSANVKSNLVTSW